VHGRRDAGARARVEPPAHPVRTRVAGSLAEATRTE
jgi:hypothetical protein